MPFARGFGFAIRAALGFTQGLMRLFAAGAVFYEAHRLFLRYYAREWGGMQFAGVNDCAGVDRIANADLIEGQTFCNQPINFVPWVELYRRHWQAACIYYAVIAVLLVLVGMGLSLLQRRLANARPFGGGASPPPSEREHLR